ncbi:MAG: hypothetical protein HC875_32430 [Anaerolineales bacterium]|nr:hypothetical protein [Anaerolineales bacterium]
MVSLPGPNIVETIVDYARSHNITKIIAGKPLRSPWLSFLKGSLVDQLINQSGDIDVYVISSATETPSVLVNPAGLQPHRPWSRYLQSLSLVALAILVGEVIDPLVSPANLVMLFLLAVVIASLRLGRGRLLSPLCSA